MPDIALKGLKRCDRTILAIPGLKYNLKTLLKQKWFYPENPDKTIDVFLMPLLPTACRMKRQSQLILVLVFLDNFLEVVNRHFLRFNGDVFPDVLHDLLAAQLIV